MAPPPDDPRIIDYIYNTCDSWHLEGLFGKSDALLVLVMEGQSDEWLAKNVDLSLSLATITFPAKSKLTRRKEFFLRTRIAYLTHLKDAEFLLAGLE